MCSIYKNLPIKKWWLWCHNRPVCLEGLPLHIESNISVPTTPVEGEQSPARNHVTRRDAKVNTL